MNQHKLIKWSFQCPVQHTAWNVLTTWGYELHWELSDPVWVSLGSLVQPCSGFQAIYKTAVVLNRTATITFFETGAASAKKEKLSLFPLLELWLHYADGHQKVWNILSLTSSYQSGMKTAKKYIYIFFFICNLIDGLDLLGIPDTSLRGLNTRTARRVRKSKSEPTVERMLRKRRHRHTKSAHRLINI